MDKLKKGINRVLATAEQDMSKVPENWESMSIEERGQWLDKAKGQNIDTKKLESERQKSREKWLADKKAEFGDDFNEGLYNKVVDVVQRLGNERGYPAGYDLSKEIKKKYEHYKKYMDNEDDYEWIN